jgi:energy-coupling factor transporter ATP-binding protein EcfA2
VTANAYDPDRLREQIEILRREAAQRSRLEREIDAEHEAGAKRARAEAEAALDATRKKYAAEIEATRREYATVRGRTKAAAEAEQAKLDEQRKKLSTALARQAQQQEAKAREDDQFDEMQAREKHREDRKQPQRHHAKAEKELAQTLARVSAAEQEAARVFAACGLAAPPPAAEAEAEAEAAPVTAEPLPAGPDLQAALEALVTRATEQAHAVATLPAARRAFGGPAKLAAIGGPLALAVAAGLAAIFIGAPGGFAQAVATRGLVAGGAAAGVAAVGLGLGIWQLGRARARVREEVAALRAGLDATLADARRHEPAVRGLLEARRDEQAARVEQRFAEQTEKRTIALAERIAAAHAQRDTGLADLEAKYTAATTSLKAKVAAANEAAEQKYPPRLAALEKSAAEDLRAVEAQRDARLAAAADRRTSRWAEMTDRWRQVREETGAVYAEAARIDTAAFLPWDELARDDVPLPAEPPPGLRFGSLALNLEKVPGGVSAVPELNAFGPTSWRQPATVAYPVNASLLIKTTAEQKEVSSAMMQAMMLRIATGLPPGQSRFTIIDPIGLGKQFAGFMHLADHDELLVTSRIWTEPPLIEEKLADITEQMEVVIQKYLRNEYPSIGAYNADAEVPEPYRFVAVANFPANFTETSARRLASIAASGPRCGVYVIASVDPSQMMPSGFSLTDLEQHAATLVLKDGVFTWNDPEFSKWPLTVEQAPSDEVFTRIIQRVGKAAKAAKRVEVPFDRVAPQEEDWWKGSTASEVVAPLGPAGAKKLQYLRLGRGTSQHALIAGKTGSGKSTLMHAMITSLAVQYSPNEIQFYLIDFKKGVEFKLYDHYKLPHARVIAIESEREFGLSVLQQLDAELKRRGDLFRELSVQDVAGFRKTGNPDPMPRILLLIDEFQEMFVEDDKLAQDASLILDRLVRQGRAFGMHVLLGSQTLGGSYSLPRATMGQMAVRIALQCNEADSSLILSEDNTAARLLTRPGEAIYNDANGMVEGNNPFQVVFLNDERRERYLGALRALADRRDDIPKLPRIVFDGNEAADPAGNKLLTELLAAGTVHGKQPVAPLAWLGDAIAIKDPTGAIFRRQGGANMLVVGQREDLGTSLLAMSIVSLACGADPHPGGALGRPARFVLLEPAIAEEKPDILLAKLADRLPHEIDLVGRFGVGTAVEALAAEIARRIEEQVVDGESVFLVIRDLARFRELRRDEGDFGFSMGDKKASPAQNFVTILKDGPTVGIHTIIWCDSLTNLQRTFDRNTLKEFELRVLFQMSSADSSQLVDSPLASKLGPQRALFIHEETGTLEKFRPYAFPTPEWLGSVAAEMAKRPQGTPVPRAAASAGPMAEAKPAAASDLGSGFGGGFGDFNFAKMLDDVPGVAPESPSGGDSDPSA